MLKFFRRGKSDKSDRETAAVQSNAKNAKKESSATTTTPTIGKENAKSTKSKLSTTLGNSLLLSKGGKSLSTSTKVDKKECADSSSKFGVKNKVFLRNSQKTEDQNEQPLKLEELGSGRDRGKFNYLKKSDEKNALTVFDAKGNDLKKLRNVENAKKSHTKEKSSRNEIVDPWCSDRRDTTTNKTTTPSCDANNRLQSNFFDKTANTSTTTHVEDNRQVLLKSSKNQCQVKNSQPPQQQDRTVPNRCSDQPPNALISFNPLNKSREFFYEIMGKNRNRNRNRNRNKDTKPYHRVLIVQDQALPVARDIGSSPGIEEQDPCRVVVQQNDFNEKTVLQRKNQFIEKSQPLECGNVDIVMPKRADTDICSADTDSVDGNNGQINFDTDPEYKSNEFIDEEPVFEVDRNENEENSENFGYQITKSKNRTNLVTNYEGKSRDVVDREKNIENNPLNDDGRGNSTSSAEEEQTGDQQNQASVMGARENVAGEINSNDCADALPSDANCIEFENSVEENEKSGNCENLKNVLITAEYPKEKLNLEGCQTSVDDINLLHEYHPQRRSDDDASEPLQQEWSHDRKDSNIESGSSADEHRPVDHQNNVVPASSSFTEDDSTIEEAECPNSSEENSTETLSRIDIDLENDQTDLEEEKEEEEVLIGNRCTLVSTHWSACDRDSNKNNWYQEEADETSMGQDNSKSASDRNKRSTSDHVNSNLVIPTITVADYSDASAKDKKKDNSNSASSRTENKSSSSSVVADTEVFYDTETFDPDPSYSSQKISQKVTDNEKDFTEKFEPCESGEDRVVIEDDLDDEEDSDENDDILNNFADIPTTVINESVPNQPKPSPSEGVTHSDSRDTNLSNTSSSSTISRDSKNTDSGIEILEDSHITVISDSGEHFLQIDRESDAFVRGGSTDCDENFLLQSDNEDHDFFPNPQNRQTHFDSNSDFIKNNNKKEKSILIDSISLPDVVVESEAGVAGMGNSHSVKTVDHIEDRTNHRNLDTTANILTDHNDNETRDLINQEARYSAQLDEAKKLILSTQTKVNDLQAKIDSLEKELSVKSWNVDRLQGELQAANKEDACVRRRLVLLQEELVDVKQKYSENEYELNQKYDELKTKHHELMDNYRHTQNLANALQTQLTFLQSDLERNRLEKQKLCEEKDTELKNLQELLKESQEKHKELEIKWQKEFETLRNQNADREEHLMSDCEWKLRTMQKSCKDKLEAAKKEKSEALKQAEEISTRATEELEHVQHLLPLEAEIKQLRGLTNEQRESLVSMSTQMADLKNDLEAANKQLEEEVENVRKIRLHCDNALSDKDRQMIQRIEEARGIVAVQWERRLLEEMTRLKQEVEMVHAEERREELDKLQQEHIEEIKVLTCRYDANEEELRQEIAKLRDTLHEKCDQLNDLKERTDAALLETRLHLERADTEYQKAMNREIEKRDLLAEQLKAEFEQEKLDMEEKFCERLNQVKEEFARELVNTREDLTQKHRKQLGKQPLAYGKKHLSKLGTTYLLSSEQQWEKLIAEKEDALHTMENRYRIRLEEAENRVKELEIQHQREMKQIRNNYEIERKTLESRDLQNSQEIEQLHRKCRCLTNLFEEMRMRYERREPRPEDLREIAELRERCESQERDLHALTERLREIQMEREENENSNSVVQRKMKAPPVISSTPSQHRKPAPKTIPTNCDVIYEENEERESPHKENIGIIDAIAGEQDEDDEDDEEDDSEVEDNENDDGNVRVEGDGKESHHDSAFILVES